MSMKYKIGDVSKILGISTDLLRYYEKKGVVRPQKDEYNDYRYYDAWDINFLIDCVWYKNFGFGIEQIGHMVTSNTYAEITDSFEEKERGFEETIRRTQLLLDRSREHRKEIEDARSYLWKCDLRTSPEMVRYINRYNSMFDNSRDLQRLSKKWLDYMPFAQRCFEMDLSSSDEGDEYRWGFSLKMNYVKTFNVEIQPPVVHMSEEESIYSVFSSSGKGNFSPQILKYMSDYAHQNQLKITGSARGNLLCSAVENGKLTGMFEVWLPVK